MWTGCERSSSRAIETTINGSGNGSGGAAGVGSGVGGSCVNVGAPGSSQHETLADIEHISTIAGSLVSIGSISHTQPRYGTNDAGYDTEHTSLNSDFDEAELRRELLRDFDPEGFGEITVDEFINALKSPEFISQVPMNKRELLLERAKKAKLPIGPGYITFQDFVNVVSALKLFSPNYIHI
ncbi:hypothetical protein FF38_13847 [Lucilia cuprina]|uniref:EF-hand domain-containing protein n=1 Tax=Lucilia cuprina TaxID=7375 RepID=A0A0L0C4K0_LUCCU|nr:hypothetical protein FF38_13847 [Lucilia cuprina]